MQVDATPQSPTHKKTVSGGSHANSEREKLENSIAFRWYSSMPPHFSQHLSISLLPLYADEAGWRATKSDGGRIRTPTTGSSCPPDVEGDRGGGVPMMGGTARRRHGEYILGWSGWGRRGKGRQLCGEVARLPRATGGEGGAGGGGGGALSYDWRWRRRRGGRQARRREMKGRKAATPEASGARRGGVVPLQRDSAL